METKPLVVIVGETASGKSALAMELARKFNGEIVAADSWSVYRGFDIGTAKPTKRERTEVPHHLLDIADPEIGFNAAEFKKQANKAILDIQNRGKLPLLAGGTGLYIDSVIYDYGFLPAGQLGQRQELESLSQEELLKQIKKQKIDTAGIDLRNKRRLIRLIETKGKRPNKKPLRPNTIIIGLNLSKERLKRNATKRINSMLQNGLEAEVKQLSQKYSWQIEPMKGIGYREFKEYFEGQQSLTQVKERIINSTIQLAKKQRTWFKRNKSIHWTNSQRQAVDFVTTELNK